MRWRVDRTWSVSLRWAIAGAVTVVAVSLIAGALGMRINVSRSAPAGFYREVDARLERGRYIVFCLPDSPVLGLARQRGYVGPGPCAGGAQYLLKKIAALPGDIVSVNAQGAWVNGQIYPLSRPMQFDGAGRPLPRLELANYQLKPGELLLLSGTYAASFDGRYFGVISSEQVRSTVVPLLTW